MNTIMGKKIGMTSIFDADGKVHPVTVVEIGPCPVIQVKTLENDGYEAVQLGFIARKEKQTNKPMAGHFKKYGVEPKQFVKEFRFEGAGLVAAGTVADISMLKTGDVVRVTGVTKGKGFQGVVKRHGMRLQGASHGTHESHRGPGSIGMCTHPGRVFKGKHMAGRMGTDQITIKNLEIMKVVPEENIVFIKGSVPGGKNSVLKIIRQEA